MSDLLSIGGSGVAAYQRALSTVSNNIANVGTEGYVRQETALSETMPRQQGRVYLGTGTAVTGIKRAYDQFLENNLRNTTSEFSTQGPMVDYANRVIDIMGSDTIGLPSALDQFFSTARQLSADPASTIMRAQFLRDADGLASRFRELSTQITSVDTETREAINARVADINTLSSQIAIVNQKLGKHPLVDRQPPDLLDQRDLLLTKLSKLVKINVTQKANGAVDVNIGSGAGSVGIVSHVNSVPLEARFDERDLSKVTIVADPYSKTPADVIGISSGELGGLLGFREQVLEPTMTSLDFLATTVADGLNAIHANGMDARGDVGGPLFKISQVGRVDARSGETVMVDRAAAGISVAVVDPSRVAAASLFRVIENEANLSGADAVLSYAPSFTTDVKPLNDVIKNNAHPSAGIVPKAGAPLAQLPIGSDDWSLYLDGATDLQNLQVFTRDGRHLMGAAIDNAQEQDSILRPEHGFIPGTTYSDDYLNRSGEYGYKQIELFYGDRAIPGSQISPAATFTPTHLALPSYLLNKVDEGKGKPLPAGLTSIPSGTLTINGRDLPVLLPRAPATTLQASDLARWISDATLGMEPAISATAYTQVKLAVADPAKGLYINGYAVPADPARSGAAGVASIRDYINTNMVSTAKVIAEVDDAGRLVISNAPGFEGDDIRIGAMAPNGDPDGEPTVSSGQLVLDSDADIRIGYGPEGADGALGLLGRPEGRYYTEQLPVKPTDAVLYGTTPIGRDLYQIDGSVLNFNGKRLDRLEIRDLDNNLVELQASDVAEWLNRTGETLEPPVVVTAATAIYATKPRLDGSAGLTINGFTVAGPYTTAKALVDAINNTTGLQRAGVGASIDDKGAIILENFSGKDIVISGTGASPNNALGVGNGKYKGGLKLVSEGEVRLGFAGDGRASELAKLGMRSGLHIEGALKEDLLVFVTGEGGGTVSGSYGADMRDPADLAATRLSVMRSQDFEVSFTASDRYQITWTNPASGVKTVVAERRYDPEAGIVYQGVKLALDRPPVAGDRFLIDGNQDGVGNNENMLDIVAYERKRAVEGPNGGTLSQAYEQTVGKVGNFSSQAAIAQKALEVVNNQAIDARDKVSGVSLDDEAADLIRFQQAYQASAKTMQVASELFDAILQAAR